MPRVNPALFLCVLPLLLAFETAERLLAFETTLLSSTFGGLNISGKLLVGFMPRVNPALFLGVPSRLLAFEAAECLLVFDTLLSSTFGGLNISGRLLLG